MAAGVSGTVRCKHQARPHFHWKMHCVAIHGNGYTRLQ